MSKRHVVSFVLPIALAVAGCFGPQEHPASSSTIAEPATPALRAKTDMARGLRWELQWGSVAVYDIATERLIRAISLPGAILSGAAESCVPDMLLTRSGALIVSSNAQPVLWRISPARFEVERFDIDVEDGRQRDVGFSGLAFTANDRELYAASAATGTLWRIDLAAGRGTPVELSAPIVGACGLGFAPGVGLLREPVLSVTIGSVKAARRVHLSQDRARGEVRVFRNTDLASAR